MTTYLIVSAALDEVSQQHHLISSHRCSCGWEGDSAVIHIIDSLRLEKIELESPFTLDKESK